MLLLNLSTSKIILFDFYSRDSTSSESNQISPASSVSMIEEKEVEEIVKTLPEGCGMKGRLGLILSHDTTARFIDT